MALALYVPMTVEIIRARGAGQSFATWGLWAVLDTILTITLWQQHGNYLLSLGFAVGGVALAAVLLAQGNWNWGRFETVIALMVLAGLAVWKFSGPRNAMIAVTAAVCIAGVPGSWTCCAIRNRRRASSGRALPWPTCSPSSAVRR